MPDPSSILDGWGDRLAAARTRANLTQSDLAAAIGVSLITVQRWEANPSQGYARQPRPAQQIALADALGVPVTTLFPRTDDEATIFAEYDQLLERVGGGCS